MVDVFKVARVGDDPGGVNVALYNARQGGGRYCQESTFLTSRPSAAWSYLKMPVNGFRLVLKFALPQGQLKEVPIYFKIFTIKVVR